MAATIGIFASFVPFINLYLASAIKHNIILKFAKSLDQENDENLSKESGEGFLGAIGVIIFIMFFFYVISVS